MRTSLLFLSMVSAVTPIAALAQETSDTPNLNYNFIEVGAGKISKNSAQKDLAKSGYKVDLSTGLHLQASKLINDNVYLLGSFENSKVTEKNKYHLASDEDSTLEHSEFKVYTFDLGVGYRYAVMSNLDLTAEGGLSINHGKYNATDEDTFTVFGDTVTETDDESSTVTKTNPWALVGVQYMPMQRLAFWGKAGVRTVFDSKLDSKEVFDGRVGARFGFTDQFSLAVEARRLDKANAAYVSLRYSY